MKRVKDLEVRLCLDLDILQINNKRYYDELLDSGWLSEERTLEIGEYPILIFGSVTDFYMYLMFVEERRTSKDILRDGLDEVLLVDRFTQLLVGLKVYDRVKLLEDGYVVYSLAPM